MLLMTRHHLLSAVALFLLVAVARADAPAKWASILSAKDLLAMPADRRPVLLDARSLADFAKGHLPGAISLPGASLRTPAGKPGTTPTPQDFFTTPQGQLDVARYEKLLGEAGLTREDAVVVYGNHAGTTDGSVPAMVLQWLGHEKVQFLDGVALTEWQAAGGAIETTVSVRPVAKYVARPVENFVWNLPDVTRHLKDDAVVFYDTRSTGEYTGQAIGQNARGGHIPGAVHLDYAAFLTDQKTALPPAEVQAKLQAAGITPEKKIVLYCQTSTRVSLPLLMLRDLGYNNLAIYDAGWLEYGNRPETLVESGEKK